MTKESLHNGTVFVDYLCNQSFLESRRGKKIINEHMLLGWLANQPLKLEQTLAHMAKMEFKRQWHLNQSYLDLLQELAPLFKKNNIKPTLLKGAILIESIYPELGTRSMSDIDILVEACELKITVNILKEMGFEEPKSDREKWKANAHKVVLLRNKNGFELVVELHTSLLYHCKDPKWELIAHTTSPYQSLSKEDFLLFQCTHLGFQHSFLKIFWILDIHYWLTLNLEIDEAKVIEQATKYRVYNSLIFTLYILKTHFKTPLGTVFEEATRNLSPLKRALLSLDFIIDPKRKMSRYLLIKHLCKDSIMEGLAYDLGWIKNKLRFF